VINSPVEKSTRQGDEEEVGGKMCSNYHCQIYNLSGQNVFKNAWRPGFATLWMSLSASLGLHSRSGRPRKNGTHPYCSCSEQCCVVGKEGRKKGDGKEWKGDREEGERKLESSF